MRMTWIETHVPSPARPDLMSAMQDALAGYPIEYGPGREAQMRVSDEVRRDSIVRSHSLMPEVLRHVFAGYREALSPDLPLARRQQEMIAVTVSALNECHY
jgi:hypothetical protein